MQGKKELYPRLMYNVSLDALVSQDNYYRRLDAALDLRFLYKATERYYGKEGQESIDPVVFFKILLVGYLNNIQSDRKLMDFCANCLDIRLFLRYDLDEKMPWHSTISRTRQLFGEELFLELFRKVLSLCVERGMVRGKRQAVDSAFVKANASMDSLLEKQVNDDAEHYAHELNEGSEYQVTSYRKKRVEQHNAWKKKTYKDQPGKGKKDAGAKDEFGNEIRGKYLSNHTHYSPTDPDARIAVKPGKTRQMNYYSQLSVDDGHHVITGALADHADKRDSQCLAGIMDQTIDNLKPNQIQIDQIAADAGYSSAEALRYCQQKGLDAYIPNFGQYKPTREGFEYNKEKDQYECQRGHKAILHYKKTTKSHDNYHMKVYRSSNKDCKNCPLRSTCIGKSDFKSITESVDKPLYDAMHAKLQSKYARHIARKRSSTVEPVLGTLINFMSMRRVNTRGLKNANKHVLMAALCYNLKKYMAFKPKKTKVIAMALGMEVKNGVKALEKAIFGLLKPHSHPEKHHNILLGKIAALRF
jgi:transposase